LDSCTGRNVRHLQITAINNYSRIPFRTVCTS